MFVDVSVNLFPKQCVAVLFFLLSELMSNHSLLLLVFEYLDIMFNGM